MLSKIHWSVYPPNLIFQVFYTPCCVCTIGDLVFFLRATSNPNTFFLPRVCTARGLLYVHRRRCAPTHSLSPSPARERRGRELKNINRNFVAMLQATLLAATFLRAAFLRWLIERYADSWPGAPCCHAG